MASVIRRTVFNSLRPKVGSQLLSNYKAVNEPVLEYRPASQESKDLEEALNRYQNQITDVPIVVGDEEIRTKDVRYQVQPFDHKKKLASYYCATSDILRKAIDSCLKARHDWERLPQDERSQIFLRAADLLSKRYRMDIMAATMLGQAKNIVQAEIDAAAELIDFLRFDVMFAQNITEYQPLSPSKEVTNQVIYRGCEGFWAAVCPFNFTAIGGHLPQAPALMGNVVLWKPSNTAVLSNYIAYKAFREAGLPPGVINFVPAEGPVFGNAITASSDLAGINFTGSVPTFKHMWKQVASNLDIYKTFPRLIGECGGKNFHFVHASADLESVALGTIRSAYEYNGQKCSACSRLYAPQSVWHKLKSRLLEILKEVKMGSPLDRESFVTAVIDDRAFARIKSYLELAKSDPELTVIAGGSCDDSKGYYVEPTIVETNNPVHRIMQEEIFGPILTVYAYPDDKFTEAAELASRTSIFGLTGAIYVEDQQAREFLINVFHDAVGNFYINDKSTGSVVGQQPFGGARLSGTNDKAGGPYYLTKFISQQSIKESKVPLRTWRYPYMEQ